MTFHVLSVPMYPTRKEITLSAFVQKVYKFCKHMTKRGHTVYHYGHPDSDVPCTEHFDVVSYETHQKDYNNQDWKTFIREDTETSTHKEFNGNANKILKNTTKKDDIILAFWGYGNQGACQNIQGHIVEPSIGYNSCFAPNRVFETYNHMHTILGIAKSEVKVKNLDPRIGEPRWSDHVIAPGFEEEDFTFSDKKDDHLLFLGRMKDAKGICEAQGVAQATKTKIKFVGPQNMKNSLNKNCKYSEFIDTVSFEERAKLLSGAKALMMPSLYTEPCGWGMIEAFFSGTPVISTDWGGMSEYNLHGVTGYRCRSFGEFYHAVMRINDINPENCKKWAKSKFLVEDMCNNYENYFNLLINGFNIASNNQKFTVVDTKRI